MNIVVLGAGAVGGYFGGRLAAAGFPVTFLARRHRAKQLLADGLHIQSIHGDAVVRPHVITSAIEVEHPDLVIVAVKNYHLQEAMADIRTLVGKGAKVLPLLNGLQHMDRFVSAFGRNAVWGGLCHIEATLDAKGHVLHTSALQDVTFGSLTGTDLSSVQELAQAFRDSGVNAHVSSDILVDMWQKFIFLTSFSGITATTRRPIGDILSDPVAHDFLKDMVAEIVSVATVKYPGFPADMFNQVMHRLHSLSPTMTSSLHRDLEKGAPLEIDSLQGAVLLMATEHDLKTPCVRAVYAILHPYRDGAATTAPARETRL